MRLYAFLLVAAVALHARAATIPEVASEKKIDANFPEDIHKTPDSISSEPELVAQANTIENIGNKLRVKPEDIPVDVEVENVQPSLQADDELEEINRPVPDLRNPGPPQRQEHETQNPESYASEQQPVLNITQSIIEAQNVLKQGFQKITDGIQNVIGSKEQVETIQQNILSVREGFTDQINKINETIQKYFTETSSNNLPFVKSAVMQTRVRFHQLEAGLDTIKDAFNRGVKNLADGIEIVALKSDTEKPSEKQSSNSTVIPFQQQLQDWYRNLTNIVNNALGQIIGSETRFTTTSTLADEQSGSQVTTASPAGQVPSWIPAPIQSLLQNFINNWQLGTQPATPQTSTEHTTTQQSTQTQTVNNLSESPNKEENKPDGHEAEKPTETTSIGPIRQILQNNPITNAVQKLQQNIVNPEKPREVHKVEEQKTVEVSEEDKEKYENESIKEGFYIPPPNNVGTNTSDNNDVNGSRIEENLTVNEEEKIPEVEKPKEDKIEALKTQVVDKTE